MKLHVEVDLKMSSRDPALTDELADEITKRAAPKIQELVRQVAQTVLKEKGMV